MPAGRDWKCRHRACPRRGRPGPYHRHCIVCGRPILKNHRSHFCGRKCKEIDVAARRRARSVRCWVQREDQPEKRLRRWIPRKFLD